MAGINAARAVAGKAPVTLGRDTAYIGVLIDDLVTKGVDEPYRMFTSRAEYRILLRQDDADIRLTPIGHEIGLATDERYEAMLSKRRQRDELIEWCAAFSVKGTPEVNALLESCGSTPLSASVRLIDLLRRPHIGLREMASVIPSVRRRIAEIEEQRRDEIAEAAEILVKYEGYIARERDLAAKMTRLDYVALPADFDYEKVTSLSTEARQKLSRLRPQTIGQASRVPGVSPADVSILLLMMNR